ncbi:carbon-nitrogen hydrolase family protein [Emticicia sp. BO119]|uniref:carbon-nitrogen hydrolase family protein n=1 Tax=Emticicia sp. BO119 TaxID=2757768 RepID=UPI0015EFE796|nr:carbon-nitrogen hydrolase family protein [Emticicia sp. BO119]MBA4849363.1 carbon-nitrogen hydrolase family protein [Emticicia sp. BO119]
MKICLAQAKAVKGNIEVNITNHLQFIHLALEKNAKAIFFPELSLTGYEPKLAGALATKLEDKRLSVFQQMADAHNISIGVGIPIRNLAGIEITMLIFQANKPQLVYAKQQLHTDELPYFVESNQQILLWPDTLKLAPAICYESLQISHAKNAHTLGAKIYLASVAKPEKGINKAYLHYPIIAAQYQMPVLMVNCVGYCDNFQSVGGSSVWDKSGNIIASLDSVREGVLVFDLASKECISAYR